MESGLLIDTTDFSIVYVPLRIMSIHVSFIYEYSSEPILLLKTSSTTFLWVYLQS